MPNAAGGSSDVWKANDPAGTSFALKALRLTQQDNFSEIKQAGSFSHVSGQTILM